jgi:hypothetical protein
MANEKEKIEKEIAEMQALIDDASVPPDEKEFAKGEIADLKAKLAELEKEEKKEEKAEEKKEKQEAKAEEKKEKKERKKREKKPKAEKKETARERAKKRKEAKKPKEPAKEPDCDDLIKQYRERRSKAKERAGKRDKAVTKVIGDTMLKAVKKSISYNKQRGKVDVDEFRELGNQVVKLLQQFKKVLTGKVETRFIKTFKNELNEILKEIEKKQDKSEE